MVNMSSLKEISSWLIVMASTLAFAYFEFLPLPWAVIFPMLIWAAYTDLRYMVIPNSASLGIAAAGIYLNGAEAIPGLLICFIMLLPFAGGIGMGDIKLYSSLGAALGYLGAIHLFLYASILALLYVFILMVRKRKVVVWLQNSMLAIINPGSFKTGIPSETSELRKVAIPLGAFFLPGAMAVYFFKG